MHQLAPLPVVIPLLTAAAIVVTNFAPRRVHDVMATAAAAAMTVLCALLLAHSADGPVIEWLGGWRPHHGVALGIALAPDQLGAGTALLVSTLLTAALVYSWTYFDDLNGLVHALMLVLGAAMVGFSIAGDLFTMIVFFVLMTVPAMALTAVENEHKGPLQGAINFAVLNSVAGFAALVGAALVYGRTGALNLAQISLSLDHHPADALVAVSCALLLVAFLTKAGAAPFHFWVPDAHAVAPTPIAGLYSGAMVTTALFGVARLLDTAFAQTLESHQPGVRAVLVAVGVVTAVGSAFLAFQQRHLKRMLAFVTTQQIGIMLCGIALFRSDGLAGAALTAIGAGFTLMALFGATGILLRRYGSTDEFDLRGRGRGLPFSGIVFLIGGLMLALVPPPAAFAGSGLIGNAARAVGYGWLPVVLAVSSALAGAAVLRAGGRVFLGWGAPEQRRAKDASEEQAQEESAEEEEEDQTAGREPSVVLRAVPFVLLVAAIAIGLLPGFVASVQTAAGHFRDVHSYIGVVLDGRAPNYAHVATDAVGALGWICSACAVVGAVLLAALGLRGRSLLPAPAADALRAVHSGHVGDYVAWWTFGLAMIGAALLWTVAG